MKKRFLFKFKGGSKAASTSARPKLSEEEETMRREEDDEKKRFLFKSKGGSKADGGTKAVAEVLPPVLNPNPPAIGYWERYLGGMVVRAPGGGVDVYLHTTQDHW